MLRSFILFSAILLFGCGSTEKKETDVAQADSKSAKSVSHDSISLPVYDFGGLEPFLNKQDEKTYIVNFWATWCKPCVKELPYFEKINEEYAKKDVEVILVSLDFPKQWESQLVPFVKKRNIKSKVIILDDPKQNTWIPKVDESWSGAIPATIIYNKQKRSFYERSFSYDELRVLVDEFLKNSI